MVDDPPDPAEKDTALALNEYEPASMPTPVRAMACGLLEALSVRAMDASRVPNATGLKVTVMAQVAFTATLVQVLV